MKKHFIGVLAVFLGIGMNMYAAERVTVSQVTKGFFSAETLSAVTPLKGTSNYAQISNKGKQISVYSFTSGRLVGTLLDVEKLKDVNIGKIDGYLMSDDGKKMLIQTATEYIYRRSFKADFYVYDLAQKTLKKLSNKGKQQIPAFSPDGKKVAFVRENNIFLVDLTREDAEEQITFDGKRNEIINGLPDWVYEEEFAARRSFVFNADGTMVCWIRYDETAVKTYALQMYKGLSPAIESNADYPGEYAYKYPKAGYDNSKVTAWSYDIKQKKTRQIDLPLDDDGYIPRLDATKDAQKVLFYTMNRHQDNLKIYAANPRTGASGKIVDEKISKYVREESVVNACVTEKYIILPSDRNGYMHLYVYDMQGKLLKTIDTGTTEVKNCYGMDEKTGDVYFQTAAPTPMDRAVYVMRKNGRMECLTKNVGTNGAVFSADYKYFIRIWSDSNHPYVYTLCNNKGKEMKTLIDNQKLVDKLAACSLPDKQFFTFKTSGGIELNGWMMLPKDFDEQKKYPVVMHQYSGPGSQQVVNSWSIGSMGQGGSYDYVLAQEGFIVVSVDGRGTGSRGADFEKCTYLRLGEKEAEDQVEAAKYLATLAYVDAHRIGIWGWSFGGFTTLMSMSEGSRVFKAGVAIAPPTNWKFYDSIYTERFMRTPKENPDGYNVNPIVRAEKLHGKLLICHGLADDNVHPQNAFEYAEELVQKDKDFVELYYTNRNHGISGGNTRNHLLRQVLNFFKDNL
ncbi:MAG: S9 family peptidase [Prevotella sp.]|nr:S9 family peptidase [Prevotella sp.]